MRRRAPAWIVLFGIVATAGAWLSLDLLYACLAALATITYAAFAPSIVGSTPIPPGSAPDPAEVRSWRETHPDSTVSEAIDTVTKLSTSTRRPVRTTAPGEPPSAADSDHTDRPHPAHGGWGPNPG